MEKLEYADLFGTTCTFYIEKRRKYYTIYGGILSILSIICYISFFVVLNYNDFKREIPITTISSIPSAGYRKIKPGEEKIWIPWRIMDYAQDFVNHTNILYPVISYRQGNRIPGTNKMSLINKILPYKLCNETSMKNIDKNIFLFNYPIDEFYCIDMDDIFIGGGWNNDFLYFIQLDLYLCENGTNYNESSNCTSFEELRKNIGPNNSWEFEYLYPVVQFQPTNLEYPGIVLYKIGLFHLSQFTNKINRLYLKEYVINDDLGWFRDTPKNHSFWGITSISGDNYYSGFEKDLINEGSTSRLYSFKIYFDMGIDYYTRKYKKITELLIDTLPILSVLFSIFKTITSIFKTASTNKKLIELLFENVVKKRSNFTNNKVNDQCKIKAKTKNYSNRIKLSNLDKFKNAKDVSSFGQLVPNNQNNSSGFFRELNNNNNKNNNFRKSIFNCSPLTSMPSIKKRRAPDSSSHKIINLNYSIFRSKLLFPYRYYFFSVFLKILDTKKHKKLFSLRFIHVYNYLSQLIDIKSYLELQKQFGLLKLSVLNEENLNRIESPHKINIGRKHFIRDINFSLKDNKLNLISPG